MYVHLGVVQSSSVTTVASESDEFSSSDEATDATEPPPPPQVSTWQLPTRYTNTPASELVMRANVVDVLMHVTKVAQGEYHPEVINTC